MRHIYRIIRLAAVLTAASSTVLGAQATSDSVVVMAKPPQGLESTREAVARPNVRMLEVEASTPF